MFKVNLKFIVFSIKLSTVGVLEVFLFFPLSFLWCFCDVFVIFSPLAPLSRGLKRGSFSNTNTDWLKTRPSGNDQPPHFCFKKQKTDYLNVLSVGWGVCLHTFGHFYLSFLLFVQSHMILVSCLDQADVSLFPAWIRAVTSSCIIATV